MSPRNTASSLRAAGEAIQRSPGGPWIATRPAVARHDEDGRDAEPAGVATASPFTPAALTLCALAARTLGWRPHEFWAATPAELAAALGLLAPGGSETGIDRETLQRLMEHDHGR